MSRASQKLLRNRGFPIDYLGHAHQELIVAMSVDGYWTSPSGRTPSATLYSAITREIATKGEQSRFIKTERGRFTLTDAGAVPAKRKVKSGAGAEIATATA